MTVAKVFTFILLLFQSHNVNNLGTDDGSNLSTSADDDDNEYQMAIKYISDKMATRTKNLVFSTTRSLQAEVPTARTDVIYVPNENEAINGDYDMFSYYGLPEEMVHQARFPKVWFTSSPSRTTRSLKNLFSSPYYMFRPRSRPSLNFLTGKTRDLDFASPFAYTSKKLVTSKPWYVVYTTKPTLTTIQDSNVTSNGSVPAPTTTTTSTTQQQQHTSVAVTELCTPLETTIAAENHALDKYYSDLETTTTELDKYYGDLETDTTTDIDVYTFTPTTTHEDDLETYNDATVTEAKGGLRARTNATTKSKRYYAYPSWICYECGKKEKNDGTTFCMTVFDVKPRTENKKMHSLRYRCAGDASYAYGCFKRFLDVGHYNERGCRNWPPRRSGKTFASKRLRALERTLKFEHDACTFTPHASLIAFGRTTQLWVRFHACVCTGSLCNGAPSRYAFPTLGPIFSLLFVIYL